MTLPARAREREAAAAVRELRPWIERRLADVERRARRDRAPARDACPTSARALSLRDEPRRTRAHRRGDVLLVPRGPGPARGDRALVPAHARAPRSTPRLDARDAARSARPASGSPIRSSARAGELLAERRDRAQLAAAARARAGLRLRRLARGLPPRRDGPLAALLGAARAPPARLPRAARLAAAQRRRARSCERGRRAVGVVGHVEHVEFAVVDRLPDAGEIVHARESFEPPRPAAARSPPCSSRGSPAPRCFSPRSATTRSAPRRRARAARARRRASTPRRARRPHAPRLHATSTHDGERTITILGRASSRTAPTRCRGTPAPSSTASTSPAATPTRVRAARAAPRPRRAVARVRRAARGAASSSTCSSRARATPSEALDAAAARPAPRLVVRTEGAARRRWRARDGTTGRWAAGAAARPDRRRLRLRRRVRRRADVRPRRRAELEARSPSAPLRRARAHRPRPVRRAARPGARSPPSARRSAS